MLMPWLHALSQTDSQKCCDGVSHLQPLTLANQEWTAAIIFPWHVSDCLENDQTSCLSNAPAPKSHGTDALQCAHEEQKSIVGLKN